MRDNVPDSESAIFFVVVIYNKECSDSVTVQYALKHRNGIRFIVIDNSTTDTDNRHYCAQRNIEYYKMNGNEGLARAYNQALKMIGTLSGYVIWSDDDTVFPDYFFEQMLETIKTDAPQVLLPLVYSNERIYSPTSIDKYGIPKRIKILDDVGETISGINSGMMVRLDTYSTFQYDEQFFLDFIDHDFCITCSEKGIPIEFNKDIILQQNAFFDSKIHLKKMVNRRKIYRKDFMYFCNKHGISKSVARNKIVNGEIAMFFKLSKQIITNNKENA